MDEDPLMAAAAAMDTYLRARDALKTVRDPALVKLAGREGSAPKAAAAMAEEMARRGWSPEEYRGEGIGPDNIRLLVREAR